MNSKHFVLGGDINRSLTEGYQLDIKKLFQDAFMITRKNILPLLSACIMVLLALTALFSLLIDSPESLESPSVLLTIFLLAIVVAPPVVTGLIMMGVNHAIGLKTKSWHLFNFFPMTIKLSLAAMAMNLITNLLGVVFGQLAGGAGIALSVITLLYLHMSFCLVYPLIAEKKLSPVNALITSFKLVHKNLGQFTQLLIIFCLLFVVGIFTSGIAFLFIIPFYMNMIGLLYRQICGVTISVTEVPDAQVNEQDSDDNDSDDNSTNDDHPNDRSGGFQA